MSSALKIANVHTCMYNLHNLKLIPCIFSVYSVFTNMAKSIAVRRGYAITDEYWKIFPPFLWLLRDVLLKIPQKDGKEVSPTEYLNEGILCNDESDGTKSMGTDVHWALNQFFPSFECKILPPPSSSNEVMQQISTNQDKLNPLFNTGVDEVIAYIKTTIKPKKVFDVTGNTCNGPTLAALVEVVADAVNGPESILALDNTWKMVVESRCRAVQEQLLEEYRTTIMDRYDQDSKGKPIDEICNPSHQGLSVLKIHEDVCTEIFDKLGNELNPLLSSHVASDCTLETIVKQLGKQLIHCQSDTDDTGSTVTIIVGGAIFDVIKKNRKRSRKFCDQLFTELYTSFKENADKDEYSTECLKADIDMLFEDYKKRSLGPEKWHVHATWKTIIAQHKDIFEKHLKERFRHAQEKREAEAKLESHLNNMTEQLSKQFAELADRQKEAMGKMTQEREAEVKELEEKVSMLELKQKEMQEKEMQRMIQAAHQLSEEQLKREMAEDKLKDMEKTLAKKEEEQDKQKATFEMEILAMKESIRNKEAEEIAKGHKAQGEIQEMKRQIKDWQQKLQQKEKEEKQRKAQADKTIKEMEQTLRKKKEKRAEEAANYQRKLEAKKVEIQEQKEIIDKLQTDQQAMKSKFKKEKKRIKKNKKQAQAEAKTFKERLKTASHDLLRWKQKFTSEKEVESKLEKVTKLEKEVNELSRERENLKKKSKRGWVNFGLFHLKIDTRDKRDEDETVKKDEKVKEDETVQDERVKEDERVRKKRVEEDETEEENKSNEDESNKDELSDDETDEEETDEEETDEEDKTAKEDKTAEDEKVTSL